MSFFRQVGVPDSQIVYVNKVPAGHAVITPTNGNACDANATPYISHCEVNGQGYDQSGALLAHIHGKLQPKAGRKMGHLNITGATPDAVRAVALQAAALLGIEAWSA